MPVVFVLHAHGHTSPMEQGAPPLTGSMENGSNSCAQVNRRICEAHGEYADALLPKSVIPHIRTQVFDFRREVKSISSVLANVVKSPGFKVL